MRLSWSFSLARRSLNGGCELEKSSQRHSSLNRLFRISFYNHVCLDLGQSKRYKARLFDSRSDRLIPHLASPRLRVRVSRQVGTSKSGCGQRALIYLAQVISSLHPIYSVTEVPRLVQIIPSLHWHTSYSPTLHRPKAAIRIISSSVTP